MLFNYIFLAICICLVSSDKELDEQWNLFKKTFNKTYTNEMEPVRKSIFHVNYLNYKYKNYPTQTYKKKFFNIYSDKNINELSCHIPFENKNKTQKFKKRKFDYRYQNLPQSFDWRSYEVITSIKDQGQCGSCWAFTTTALLEAGEIIREGKFSPIDLSEQNLIDCDDKSFGCRGGRVDWALTYVEKNKGIDTEDSYEYEAETKECRFFEAESMIKDLSNYDLKREMDEESLKAELVYNTPLAITINVDDDFGHYSGGVYNSPYCSSDPSMANHAVLLIGYGEEDGQRFWLIKNSWGDWWGEEGFGKIAIEGNVCGVTNEIVSAVFSH